MQVCIKTYVRNRVKSPMRTSTEGPHTHQSLGSDWFWTENGQARVRLDFGYKSKFSSNNLSSVSRVLLAWGIYSYRVWVSVLFVCNFICLKPALIHHRYLVFWIYILFMLWRCAIKYQRCTYVVTRTTTVLWQLVKLGMWEQQLLLL